MIAHPVMGILGGSMGGGEVMLILAVALVLFGSKNLPKVARSLGRALEEFRRAAREVSSEIMKAGDDQPPPGARKLPEKSDKKEDPPS